MKRSHRQKLSENESVFRTYNERVQSGIKELHNLAKESNQEHLFARDDHTLDFYCECSDEACVARITLKPSLYDAIHKDRSCFIVKEGHDVPEIEHVLRTENGYSVVKKFDEPDDGLKVLHETDLHNT